MRRIFPFLFIFYLAGFLGLAACGNNRNYPNRMHRGMMQDGMMNREENDYGRGGMMEVPGDSGDQRGPNNYGSGTAQQGSQTSTGKQKLSRNEARSAAEKYLQALGHPNLTLGKGTESSQSFEFPIIDTINGQQTASLEVDKRTGAVQSHK